MKREVSIESWYFLKELLHYTRFISISQVIGVDSNAWFYDNLLFERCVITHTFEEVDVGFDITATNPVVKGISRNAGFTYNQVFLSVQLFPYSEWLQ